MALSPVRGMLTTPYPLNISLSTGYRLICLVKLITPCVAMHNNNRFNEAMQVNRGLRFTQSTGEDTMATLPDMLRAEVAEAMEKFRVNVLLVTDADDRLVGALNANDLMRAKVI